MIDFETTADVANFEILAVLGRSARLDRPTGSLHRCVGSDPHLVCCGYTQFPKPLLAGGGSAQRVEMHELPHIPRWHVLPY